VTAGLGVAISTSVAETVVGPVRPPGRRRNRRCEHHSESEVGFFARDGNGATVDGGGGDFDRFGVAGEVSIVIRSALGSATTTPAALTLPKGALDSARVVLNDSIFSSAAAGAALSAKARARQRALGERRGRHGGGGGSFFTSVLVVGS